MAIYGPALFQRRYHYLNFAQDHCSRYFSRKSDISSQLRLHCRNFQIPMRAALSGSFLYFSFQAVLFFSIISFVETFPFFYSFVRPRFLPLLRSMAVLPTKKSLPEICIPGRPRKCLLFLVLLRNTLLSRQHKNIHLCLNRYINAAITLQIIRQRGHFPMCPCRPGCIRIYFCTTHCHSYLLFQFEKITNKKSLPGS